MQGRLEWSNMETEIFKAFENKNFHTWKLNTRNEEGGICFYHEFNNLCYLVDGEPLCSNYHTIALISYASIVMLKILQARLQQCVNCELPDVQAGLRKGRGTRDQIVKIRWIIEKAREVQTKSISALLTVPKTLTVWITKNCGKFSKKWAYRTTWPASWKTCMQVRKQQLDLDMEQQTGSK